MWSAIRAHANSGPKSLTCTYGELSAYDPVTHTGKFKLPMYPDTSNDPSGNTLVETGFIQIATLANGPGYGAQFVPPQDGQALIFFADMNNIMPVGALFLFNDMEQAPFPDGKTNGFMDKNGSSHTTTDDGPTAGDNAGGARTVGAKYTSYSTKGGHSFTQDDVARAVKSTSAGGFYTLYDDAGRVLSHVTPGGLLTIASDVTAEIAHIAPNIALGQRLAAMLPANAAARKQDLDALAASVNSLRRDDLVKFAAAMVAAAVPNAGAVIAQLATLVGITVPAGSSGVMIK